MTALTHSTDWHTASSAPALCRGPGAGTSGELDTETGVEPVQQTSGETVKAYTRAGADGDDFNLSCDGWAESWPGHRGLRSRHGLGDLSITECQPPFRVTARTHPSSILQSSGPGSGSGGQWLLRVRPGRGLAVYSDNRRFWWEWGAPTRFKYKLVMTPGFMDLIGTQIPRAVPSLVEAISCRQK